MSENQFQTADEWFLEIAHIAGTSAIFQSSDLITSAMASGREDVLNLLLRKGWKIHEKTSDGETPMHMAATGGYVKAMQWLKGHDVAIDGCDNNGNKPIHFAAAAGHIEAIDWLLKNGAGVGDKGHCGDTPIMTATQNDRAEMIAHLRECGANIAARDEYGLSPLDTATMRGNTEIMKLLVDLGADVNAADNEGRTPVFKAAIVGKVESIKLLVKFGANAKSTDANGRTAIFAASAKGQLKSIECLAGLGVDVNAKAGAQDGGLTAIFTAAGQGYVECVKCLARLGADIEAKAANGMTPIFIAAIEGQVESMKCLKELGARLDLVADGATPLDLARKWKQAEAVTWLENNTEMGKNWFHKALKQYANFSGRTRRKEYWLFMLFAVIGYVVFSSVALVAIRAGLPFMSLLPLIYMLAILVPTLAISARRLHDTGKSAWWLLIGLVPYVGAIVLFVFCCFDSQTGSNEYDDNPKV